MKALTFTLKTLSMILLLAVVSSAQQAQWTRYAADDGSFSALMPPGALIDAKKDSKRMVFNILSYGPTANIAFMATKERDWWRVLPMYIAGKSEIKNYRVGSSGIRRVDYMLGSSFARNVIITTKSMTYSIDANAVSQDDLDLARVLMGIRIDGKQIFGQTSGQKIELSESEAVVSLKGLQSSPELIEARHRKPDDRESEVVFESETAPVPVVPNNISRPLIFVDEPDPIVPPTEIGFSKQLPPGETLPSTKNKLMMAVVRVTFHADGRIGRIAFIGRPDREFGIAVVRAIRQIRFLPAQVDGRNVDYNETLRYLQTKPDTPTVRRYY